MSIYRIVNKESGLIYSEQLGWVKEHGEMYGHCFEWEEAELIGRKFSADGTPVIIEKDQVASRFERAARISFPKLLLMTVIGLIAKDLPLNSNIGQGPIIAIREAFLPNFIPFLS